MTLRIENQRFGRLVAIKRLQSNHLKRYVWLCRCDCGSMIKAVGSNLVSGNTKSCGCFNVDATKQALTLHGHTATRWKSPEYSAWSGLIDRCYNKNNKGYKNYGARGITVCDRWRASFSDFLSDMGLRPSPQHSIEREENNGAYEPGNCVWATKQKQARNTRSNRIVEFRGRRMTLAEAAELAGVKYHTAKKRLNRGAPIDG